MAALHCDIVSKVLGNFGKWQLRAMLIIFLCKIPTSWFMAVIIFTAPAPKPGDFWCKPPDTLPAKYETEWIAKAHPPKMDHHHHRRTDYCHVYLDLIENPLVYFGPNKTEFTVKNFTIVRCDHFGFNRDYHSLVVEFNLVCRRELLLPLTQCFHIFGLLSGGIFAYFLLKFISPRNVMIIGISMQIVCGNLTGLIRVYEFHMLFRWLTACSCALMYTAGQMIFGDITNGPAKVITSVVFELFWSIGLIILPVFALFIENWWQLYIAISTPTIFLIFFYRYLPDSPRWMLQHGRIVEAKEILISGATKNKRRIPINLEDLLKSEFATGAASPPQSTWCSIWNGEPPKHYLLAVHYAWSVYILLFNCVVLNIRAYGQDHLSINTVAIGFSEIFGVFIGMYLILYTRRRWLWTGVLGIASGCLAYFTWFIPETLTETHVVALEMMPTMAIKTATSAGLCVLTTCTADLVTADKKKILMFSAVVWSRAWFLWAPFIFMLKTYDVVLPLTVFATLIVVGGLLMAIVNHNQQIIYKEDSEQRIKNIQTIRSISNAGLDWIKGNRRKSYDIDTH